MTRHPAVSESRAATLLEGPVWRALIGLALPIVLANVLQTVYQLTDTFWVGRLGPNAVAAVSLSFPVLFLMISIGGGLAIAGAILVAQHFGAGDQPAVNHFSAQTLVSVGAVSLVISIFGWIFTPGIVTAFGPERAVAEPAVAYLRISFIGLIFQFIYIVVQSVLRSVGDVLTPFLIVLGTVILNFVLDPLFILGWGAVPAMGTAGAAIASVLTQGIAMVVGLWMIFRGKLGIHVRITDLRPDIPVIRQMIRMGLPASVEQSTRAAGMAVMTVLVTGFGTGVLAAYGIGTRILSFVIIPALGFSMAASTLVGQAVGARRMDRAEAVAWTSTRIAFFIMLGAGVVMFTFADPLATLFLPDAPLVAAEAATFVRILSVSFGFVGAQQVLAGAFRGAGDTMAAMMLAIFALWVLRFPIAFMLSYRTTLGQTGLWWAFPISEAIAALIALVWFRTGRWKRQQPLEAHREIEQQVVQEAIVEEGLER